MAKLGTILDQVDAGSMLLPEFQRGYVWNRDQIRGLMRSIYRGYPVGTLLVWETDGAAQAVRGRVPGSPGITQLLLDGQQRVTTLYGIVRGRAPSFFEGDPAVFRRLCFHVESETFQYHSAASMKDDPLWLDVTELFADRQAQYARLAGRPELAARIGVYLERLSTLYSILERDFHVEQITGPDKTVDVVVDVFNRVNAGGTKLSKGDLALARICAEWGDARPAMRRHLAGWAERDLRFSPDWLLRNVNAIATGRAPFAALGDVPVETFRAALDTAVANVDRFLELAAGRLGLDHDRVLMGRYAVPVLSRLMHAGHLADAAAADRALHWYVLAAVRGRYTVSAESHLTKDLETADAHGVDGLVAALARTGSPAVDAGDFEGAGRGSRAYPLLYMLTRALAIPDLVTGLPIAGAAAVHEIFPKAQLARQGHSRAELGAVANYAFLTPASVGELKSLAPHYYLESCAPEVLAAQWIPQDKRLWEVENYREFLAARRELLAEAANRFLAGLRAGTLPRPAAALEPVVVADPKDATTNARTAQLTALVEDLVGMGYGRPALDVEIADPDTGRPLAVAEAHWPNGLQPGQGAPVVLELDPEEADLPRLGELGCEVFTSVDALREHVLRRNEIAAGERDDEGSSTALEPAATIELGEAEGPYDRAVRAAVDRCRDELRYNPRYFRVMISQHGALGATRRLLAAPAVSDGFVTLWERNRLDLTVETLVVDERFADLFTPEEREVAGQRLTLFGHTPAAA